MAKTSIFVLDILAVEPLPGTVEFAPQLADSAARKMELLGDVFCRLADRESLGDLSIALAVRGQPSGEVAPKSGLIWYGCPSILGYGFDPSSRRIVGVFQPLNGNADASSTALAQQIGLVETITDAAPSAELRDGIMPEYGWVRQLRSSLFAEPNKGNEGVGNGFLDSVVQGLGIQLPKCVTRYATDGR